jgi:hypothetical protein
MVPALFAPRPDAAKRFLEFFAAQIRNPNTRKAYFRAVSRFAGWCELNGLTELVDLEPVHAAARQAAGAAVREAAPRGDPHAL